jgi:hypothetical protein
VTAVRVSGAEQAPELDVARDLARRAVWLAPVAMLVGVVGWGLPGAASALFALGLVTLNFLLAAFAMARAARISLGVLMATVMISYVARLALILVATLAVAGSGWFEPVPFGATLIVAHLALLLWETRYVSASLAFPGLKPRPARAKAERD